MAGWKRRIVVLLGILLLAGGINIYNHMQKVDAVDTASSRSVETIEGAKPGSSEAVIYITGAVQRPGVLKVPAGSRIIDAVNAAGGLAPGAETAKLNLAQQVKDGMHINVPGLPSAGPAAGSATQPAVSGDRININTADKAALDKLPGVGPSTAGKIIEYRQNNGPFRDIADIKKVPGIGDSKFNQFKDKITI